MSTVLTRAVEGRAVAGVCVGLARYLAVPVSWMRIGMVVLTMLGGAGVVFYGWLWIFLPSDHEDAVRTREHVRGAAHPVGPEAYAPHAGAAPQGDPTGAPHGRSAPSTPPPSAWDSMRRNALWNGWQVIVGVVVLAMAVVLGLQVAGVIISWGVIGPAGVVLLGIAVAWLQLDTLRGASRSGRAGSALQLVLGLLLVLAGVLALAAGFVSLDELWLGLFVAVAILVGLMLVAAPWVLKAWRDHVAKRTALAAQTERAEMAAHLHDSVLQTLALIQRNAEDPVRVARYARAQERELRQYLYQDPTRPTGTLGDRLEELAETLEERHGHPIEVVTVGTAHGSWLDPLLQATQEAVRNGVRHAGPVRVYAEARPEQVEVFVRDRGTGFDPEAIPEDRLGIRESIIGRMQRAGGTATLSSGPDGTEVRLVHPRPADHPETTDPAEPTEERTA